MRPVARDYHQGDIVYVARGKESEDASKVIWTGRPMIIISADSLLEVSNTVTCIPLTSRPKNPIFGCEVMCSGKLATALCAQITTVDRRMLDTFDRHLTKEEWETVQEKLRATLGMDTVSSDVEGEYQKRYKNLCTNLANIIDEAYNNADSVDENEEDEDEE